jgi:hypothetical protein
MKIIINVIEKKVVDSGERKGDFNVSEEISRKQGSILQRVNIEEIH